MIAHLAPYPPHSFADHLASLRPTLALCPAPVQLDPQDGEDQEEERPQDDAEDPRKGEDASDSSCARTGVWGERGQEPSGDSEAQESPSYPGRTLSTRGHEVSIQTQRGCWDTTGGLTQVLPQAW